MKLQKRKRDDGKVTFLVSVPADYKNALGWKEDQKLALCPNMEKSTLTLVPIL